MAGIGDLPRVANRLSYDRIEVTLPVPGSGGGSRLGPFWPTSNIPAAKTLANPVPAQKERHRFLRVAKCLPAKNWQPL